MEESKVFDGHMQISCNPCWDYIETIRNFVKNFCVASSLSEEFSQKTAIACSELLENAVKYGSEQESLFKMSILREEKKVLIEVKNGCLGKNISALQKELDLLNSYSPQEAYLYKMKQVKPNSGKSGLGLARIRYETNAHFSLEAEENAVKVIVSLPLEY